MQTNLVIAAWSGSRRLQFQFSQEHYIDSALFLKKQVECLKKIKHNLSQVTFVIPKNTSEPREFRNYLNSIPSKINKTKVVILEKENIGLSYGSFSYAFEIYKEKFDYYIFLEDDYIFVEDNFDKTLINILDTAKNCGYLAATVYRGLKAAKHPSNFNGITTSKVLSKIWGRYGKLPYSLNASYNGAQNEGQIAYGEQLIALGYQLCDLTPYYELPFMQNGGIITFGIKNSKFIIVPVQFVSRKSLRHKIKLA